MSEIQRLLDATVIPVEAEDRYANSVKEIVALVRAALGNPEPADRAFLTKGRATAGYPGDDCYRRAARGLLISCCRFRRESPLPKQHLTLRDLLTQQARRYEKKTFLAAVNREYSYAMLDDRTDRVATALGRLGLRRGDRIALLLSNSPEFVFFFLGAPKIGLVPVPIDPTSFADEIVFAVQHSGANAVVTESRFAELQGRLSEVRHWITVDDDSFSKPPFENLEHGSVLGFWPDLDPDDPAGISYTRGTTGDPKPVVITHHNLISNCHQTAQPFRIDETDRFLCALPLSSVAAGVLLVLLPWMTGGTCILRDAYCPNVLHGIEENRATVLAWAIGVWGGVLGALLLLLRKPLAVWVFLASLLGVVVSTFRNYALANGMEVMGDPFSLGFTAAIFLVALALFLYARSLRKRGVLV